MSLSSFVLVIQGRLYKESLLRVQKDSVIHLANLMNNRLCIQIRYGQNPCYLWFCSANITSLVVSAFDRRTRMLPSVYIDRMIVPCGPRSIAGLLYNAGLEKTRMVYQLLVILVMVILDLPPYYVPPIRLSLF